MFHFFHGKIKRLSGMALGFILLSIALVSTGLHFFGIGIGGIRMSNAVEAADKYQIRCRQLMEAMQHVGVCTPEQAAETWAKGLMKRSAAMQYSVMSRQLRNEYAKRLEQTAPNWVTGISSPWVSAYRIIGVQKESEKSYVYTLSISLATSAGPAGDYAATLIVTPEDGFWRITKIATDDALYPYTGFNPDE
ncbi:MAG: hypothetical protein ACOYU3_06460 [Bacillota bacterium]